MTRWLVTGAGGQLGSDLVAVLTAAGDEVVGLTRADLDISDERSVRAAVDRVWPDVVINAAAYTAVDAAETDEDEAYRVNATGPGVLATATSGRARLLHVSTDYVFDGQGSAPYAEGDPTEPRSAYGRTKLAGERAALGVHPDAYVVRTAWVYGAGGGNFVKTMAALEAKHDTISVVDDQRGSPTWSRDLAYGLVALGRSAAAPGVYHCTNGGEATWYDLARAVFEELGADPGRVQPTTTDAFPRPAPRPAYSVLGTQRWRAAGLTPLRDWRVALGAAFAEVGPALRPPG
ncbi:MAG: dTDP-4-dehydrorhamnose reductase [Frankiales bacterium]|nr:dTDP-4-dehydrorhamnose reductase [Frankiales bacterium]MDX6221736.1 dTDP-4-dehydrorhamnose reductase [Frankiales bacterium]